MTFLVIFVSIFIIPCFGENSTEPNILEKQRFILNIFQHYYQNDLYDPDFYEYKDYRIEDNLDSYYKPDKVKAFIDFYNTHNFSIDEHFTLFEVYHLQLAIGFTRTLYLAKNFDVYKKTAIWGRYNLVKNLFVYSMHASTYIREDMKGIVLPPIYEINPFHFFNAESIQTAQSYQMTGYIGVELINDTYTVKIPTDYTGVYGEHFQENKISYFTEDVDLNAFYYYYNTDYPFWVKGRPGAELNNDKRGVLYFQYHWTLLSRYYLERLSLGLGEIKKFDWNKVLPVGYDSELRYYNGIHFPVRPYDFKYYDKETQYLVTEAKSYEQRIMNAVDLGAAIDEDLSLEKFKDEWDGLNKIGNLVQGTVDSINLQYYGNFDIDLRFIINNGIPYQRHFGILPGTLLNYETSLRDPAFYEMYSRILENYWRYAESFPPYTDKEVGFEGVKIVDVQVDELVTYFDTFYSDISNAVDVDPRVYENASDLVKLGRISYFKGKNVHIKARQKRLNHLPFNIKMKINSNKTQNATVKIYIGPTYNSLGEKIIPEVNRENYFEWDHFVIELSEGNNDINRNSDDFPYFIKDRTSYFELYEKLLDAMKNNESNFPYDINEPYCLLPNRFILPRGRKGGMPFKIFIIAIPYVPLQEPKLKYYIPNITCDSGTGARFIDNTPLGFPFDRSIDVRYWFLDNMHYEDVLIFHREDVNLKD